MCHKLFVHIINRYQHLLERYARRYMQHKQMASSVVTEVFETLHAQGKLKPGPQLRSLLKTTTLSTCRDVDLALNRANSILAETYPIPNNKPPSTIAQPPPSSQNNHEL